MSQEPSSNRGDGDGTRALPADLVERALAGLGLSDRPEITAGGLAAVYGAWSRRVPFDNTRKLIHLRGEDPGPLPGHTAEEFLESWLRDRAGGTCWAGNGALHALLSSLGFTARRAVATMLMAPGVPPNHGSVVVELEGRRYLVDATMLYDQPLPLVEAEETRVEHAAWGVSSRTDGGRWVVRWRPMLRPEGLDCRIESIGASGEVFEKEYEGSRRWGPFNYELSARVIRGDSVVGAAFGRRIELSPDGKVVREPLRGERRLQFLVEELGISEELAARVPPDKMTPAPPRDMMG